MFPDDLSGVPDGTIIGTGISQEEYLDKYAAYFCEWVNGTVTRTAASYLPHMETVMYFSTLFDTYFALQPIGEIVRAPFVMRLERVNSMREPDIQVILEANAHNLTEYFMNAPANICIEVVSPNSSARDRGEKFAEYERAGVPEYWLIDPDRRDARFYRLNDQRVYKPQSLDGNNNYMTPRLPDFRLHVPLLFGDELPGIYEIIEYVKAMLQREA